MDPGRTYILAPKALVLLDRSAFGADMGQSAKITAPKAIFMITSSLTMLQLS